MYLDKRKKSLACDLIWDCFDHLNFFFYWWSVIVTRGLVNYTAADWYATKQNSNCHQRIGERHCRSVIGHRWYKLYQSAVLFFWYAKTIMKQIKHIHSNPQLQLLFAVDNYWPTEKIKWLNRPKTSLKQKKNICMFI